MTSTRWFRGVVGAVVLALLGPTAPGAAADPVPPPTGVDWDYQLGGAAAVPEPVGIVVRDRRAEVVPGRYNVCYVNAFQTQPDEKRFWRHRWGLVLKRGAETPVADSAWGEWLLDMGTAGKRRRLVRIVGHWIDRCAGDGFDAVELDNLDSFARSRGLLSRRDARRYSARLVGRAHDAGLAAAQKNRAGWDGTVVGFDFAIAEECARWHECGSYAAHFGDLVLSVEYRRRPFRRACRTWGDRFAVLRRGSALTPDGPRRWCGAAGPDSPLRVSR